jgi:predicted RNA-binding Zn-ribbon protein involved in translation (DUF1610 family)
MISITVEKILHFVCSSCKGWWSIAVMDEWIPEKLICPHCGIKSIVKDKQ